MSHKCLLCDEIIVLSNPSRSRFHKHKTHSVMCNNDYYEYIVDERMISFVDGKNNSARQYQGSILFNDTYGQWKLIEREDFQNNWTISDFIDTLKNRLLML